jgi:hypothetical protein
MQVSIEEHLKLQKELAISSKRENILQNLMKEMRSKLLKFECEKAVKPCSSNDTLLATVKIEDIYQNPDPADKDNFNFGRVNELEKELETCRAQIERINEDHEQKVADLIHVGNL